VFTLTFFQVFCSDRTGRRALNTAFQTAEAAWHSQYVDSRRAVRRLRRRVEVLRSVPRHPKRPDHLVHGQPGLLLHILLARPALIGGMTGVEELIDRQQDDRKSSNYQTSIMVSPQGSANLGMVITR
jgi:hypothetical protein